MDASQVIAKSRSFIDDIDKLRCEWESQSHWFVRKAFLLRNWDGFKDKDRLICLSQAWFNSRFHGNSYPQQVMETLQDLEDGMDPMDAMLKQAETQVIGLCDSRHDEVKNIHDTSRLPRTFYAMKFVRQNDKSKTDGLDKNVQLHSIVRNCDNDQKMSEPNDGIVTADKKVFQSPHEESNGESATATVKKMRVPVSDLTETNLSDCKIKGELPEKRPPPFISVHHDKIKLSKDSLKKLKTLVLRRRENELAIATIAASAEFSKLQKEFVFEDCITKKSTPNHTCSIYINGVLVARSSASDKKAAKHAAAESALELLQKTQQTLLITSLPGDLESALSREEISRCSKKDDKISDSNVGNVLLRKMGWTGQGGLGRSGSGIATPVTVNHTSTRSGLGLDNEDCNLLSFNDAHDVIRNYASSESFEELTFSPELTNQERAKIHQWSRRYGLKSRSYNKGTIRYLVVSRKYSASEIVRQLKSSGGVKGNLQLISPPLCSKANANT